MQATAKEKYIKMSPTKVRQVLGLVKNQSVEDALNSSRKKLVIRNKNEYR